MRKLKKVGTKVKYKNNKIGTIINLTKDTTTVKFEDGLIKIYTIKSLKKNFSIYEDNLLISKPTINNDKQEEQNKYNELLIKHKKLKKEYKILKNEYETLKKQIMEMKEKRNLAGKKPIIDKNYIIQQVNIGKSYSEIAEELKCSKPYISKVITQYKKEIEQL